MTYLTEINELPMDVEGEVCSGNNIKQKRYSLNIETTPVQLVGIHRKLIITLINRVKVFKRVMFAIALKRF